MRIQDRNVQKIHRRLNGNNYWKYCNRGSNESANINTNPNMGMYDAPPKNPELFGYALEILDKTIKRVHSFKSYSTVAWLNKLKGQLNSFERSPSEIVDICDQVHKTINDNQ